MTTPNSGNIAVENVIRPGSTRQVNAAKYVAMKQAYLKTVPKTLPGLTVAEIGERLKAHLSPEQFPGGAKAGWWAKAVQLDLEAKGIVQRENGKPVRLHLA